MSANLTLRREKGSALTYDEMDDNFLYLEDKEQISSTLLFGATSDQQYWTNQGVSIYYPGSIDVGGSINSSSSISTAENSMAKNHVSNVTTLSSNTININFEEDSGLYRRTATGTISISVSSYTPGITKIIKIVAGGTERTLTLPTNWIYIPAKPTSILANKVGVLTLISFGTTESECVAKWEVQE
jgi:hypothetical protein